MPALSNNIINFYQYNSHLAAGGQPSSEQIRALKEDGYEVLFNISPVSTRNYLKEEAEIAEKTGFIYFHFPVDCTRLDMIHYRGFASVMNALEGKKVFVHCGGNIKTSNLIHMYNVLEKKADEAESLAVLKRIQNPEEKWFDYFIKNDMKGLR